jgi:hydroxyacylglutathione hydrolase
MILYQFLFGPLETRAILIGCSQTKNAAAIDPSPGSARALLDKAKEQGLQIKKILLTHSHWDHFADAYALQKETKAPLSVHRLDAQNVEQPGSDGLPLFIPIPAVKVDHHLTDGEKIEVGLLQLEVIHTPGHSPGGVCFYLKEQNLLIAGDTLFKGTIGSLSLPTARPNEMIQSLKKLSQLPPATRVLPGHGDETTIGKEKKSLSFTI